MADPTMIDGSRETVDNAQRATEDTVAAGDSAREPRAASRSVAGEVEGLERGAVARTLGVLTGWSLLRGAVVWTGRHVFSFRRPATLTIDGQLLRVVGHSEILGRTLGSFDVRLPLAMLTEVRREARYPRLPAALSVFALGVGALLGARSVVEGAGVGYFPLIALGLGLIVGGILFDLVLRALFPGLRGEGRLAIRATESRALVITHLPLEELDRLLDALDASFGATGRRRHPVDPARSIDAPPATSKPTRGARPAGAEP